MVIQILAIFKGFFRRFSIYIVLTGILSVFLFSVTVAASAEGQNDSQLINKLQDAILSGEVIGLALAGVIGYLFNRYQEKSKKREELRRQEHEQHIRNARELDMIRQQQESIAETKKAVEEGMSQVTEKLTAQLTEIRNDVTELRTWVRKIDSEAESALRLAEINHKTQKNWLKVVESRLSAILSADRNSMITNFTSGLDEDD